MQCPLKMPRMHQVSFLFFFQAEDGIRDLIVTGVQTCALPIWSWDRPSAANAAVRSDDPTTTSREWRVACQSSRSIGSSGSGERERGGVGKRGDLGGRRII